MGALNVEIPSDILDAMQLPPGEKAGRVRTELALRLYEKGILSFGKARELAHLSKWQFHTLLGDEGIARHYDVADLEDDLRTLEALG